MLRQRAPKSKKDSVATTLGATQPTASSNIGAISTSRHATMDAADDPRQPLLGARDDAALSQRHLSSPPSQDHPSDEERPEDEDQAKKMENLSRKSQWIVLALASGACAAFNGVFAKLYVISLLFSAVPITANQRNEKIYFFSAKGLMEGSKASDSLHCPFS
jgi:hypothetical protein